MRRMTSILILRPTRYITLYLVKCKTIFRGFIIKSMENRRNILALLYNPSTRSGFTGWHFGELRTLNIYDLAFIFHFLFYSSIIINHEFARESARPIVKHLKNGCFMSVFNCTSLFLSLSRGRKIT